MNLVETRSEDGKALLGIILSELPPPKTFKGEVAFLKECDIALEKIDDTFCVVVDRTGRMKCLVPPLSEILLAMYRVGNMEQMQFVPTPLATDFAGVRFDQ